MTSFFSGLHCSATSDLNDLALSLRFLDGRTERFEGNTVSIARSEDALIVAIGQDERLILKFHRQDNSWTLQYVPSNPWEQPVIKSEDISQHARSRFIKAVVHSLIACKQDNERPMLSQEEADILFDSIDTAESRSITRAPIRRLDLFAFFRKSV